MESMPLIVLMNQPEDGPMAKSLTGAAQIDNVEDLGTLLEADIETLSERHHTTPHDFCQSPQASCPLTLG
jgi:hypothetical protein